MRHQQIAVLLFVGSDALASGTMIHLGSESSRTLPQATDIDSMFEQQLQIGFSPRPTHPPSRHGRFHPGYLKPRQLDQTCGFREGNTGPFICSSRLHVCATFSNWVGCCDPNVDPSCHNIHTTCMDRRAPEINSCKDSGQTLCCSEAGSPACMAYTRTDTSLTLFACATSATVATAVLLNFASEPTSPGGEGASGQTNIGAIVGGVVGGAIVLALIGVAAALLLRRRYPWGNDEKPPSLTIPSPTGTPPPDRPRPRSHD